MQIDMDALHPTSHPHLRLVGLHGHDDAPPTEPLRASAKAAYRQSQAMIDDGEAVATENRRAAVTPDLSPGDPRWVVAVRAFSQLQGSAMTLTGRKQVLETAKLLGVRTFEANLIIAIAQDHARRGLRLPEARSAIAMLGLGDAARSQPAASWWNSARIVWALVLALLAAGLVIRWIIN